MDDPSALSAARKASRVYLLLVLGLCYGLGALELIFRTGTFYQILAKGFTAIPVAAAFLARRLTGVNWEYNLSLRAWKNGKAWLFPPSFPRFSSAAEP